MERSYITQDATTIKFLTVEDVAELTGWDIKTVRRLFCRPDFPCCDYGKSKLVESHALINYFAVPRRRDAN